MYDVYLRDKNKAHLNGPNKDRISIFISRTNDVNKRTLRDVICCHFETTSRKQNRNTISVQFYNERYQQKEDFIRFVCVRMAVDKITKVADCRPSRLEGKQDTFLLPFLSSN